MFKNVFLDVQLAGVSSELSGLLNYARQSAVFNRAEYRLMLRPDEAKFWIEYKVPDTDTVEFRRPPGRFGRIYLLPKGINIRSNDEPLTFYPDGASTFATITMTSSVKSYVFTTEGSRGFVKVKKHQR